MSHTLASLVVVLAVLGAYRAGVDNERHSPGDNSFARWTWADVLAAVKLVLLIVAAVCAVWAT